MHSLCRTLPRLALASLGLLLAQATAHAFTFNGTGTVGGSSVSASADFTTNGTDLVLLLKNTTSGGTPTKTQVLTGVLFTLTAANPALSLPGNGTALGTSSVLFTDPTTSAPSADLNGSYLFLSHPGGVLSASFPYEYGLSATGAGGLFPSGQFTKGGGGDDYAIVASGTNLSQSSFGSQFPYATDAVQFTLNGFGTLGLGQITDVAFLFGSDGTNVINAESAVPEPGALSLVLAGGIPATLFSLRRRARRRESA